LNDTKALREATQAFIKDKYGLETSIGYGWNDNYILHGDFASRYPRFRLTIFCKGYDRKTHPDLQTEIHLLLQERFPAFASDLRALNIYKKTD
jgi:hypothetical protein